MQVWANKHKLRKNELKGQRKGGKIKKQRKHEQK